MPNAETIKDNLTFVSTEVELSVKQFRAEMIRKNANDLLESWEKVSATVGVAFYDPQIDTCADDVFKRADKEMYANKLAMKAQRTD